MSPTVTVAPMPISSTQLLYESKKAKGQKHVRFPTLIIEFRIKISMEITQRSPACPVQRFVSQYFLLRHFRKI